MTWKVSVSDRWRNGLVPADAGIWCSGRNPIYVFYHSVALGFIRNTWNDGIVCDFWKFDRQFYCSVVVGSSNGICDWVSY